MWQILIVCDLVPHLCSRVVISNVSITAHSLWPLHVAFNTFEFFVFFLQCSLLPREVKRVTDQAIASIIKSCPYLPPQTSTITHHHPPTPSWSQWIPPLSRSRAIMAARGPNGLKGFHVS